MKICTCCNDVHLGRLTGCLICVYCDRRPTRKTDRIANLPECVVNLLRRGKTEQDLNDKRWERFMHDVLGGIGEQEND